MLTQGTAIITVNVDKTKDYDTDTLNIYANKTDITILIESSITSLITLPHPSERIYTIKNETSENSVMINNQIEKGIFISTIIPEKEYKRNTALSTKILKNFETPWK